MANDVSIHQLDPELSVSDALQKFADWPFLVVLDSAAHIRSRDARYSFLTADPLEVLRLDRVAFGDDPFTQFRQWQKRLPVPDQGQDCPPFCGGIAGLMSYELGGAFERIPVAPVDEFETPALLAGLFDWAIVWDHIQHTVRLCVLRLNDESHQAAAADQAKRVQQVLAVLNEESPRQSVGGSAAASGVKPDAKSVPFQSSFDRESYLSVIERVIEYIRAGDIFQANLSQQLTAAWDGSAVELFQHVRRRNPAPFCGLLRHADVAVVSASPERFLKVTANRYVETRPIKGTRRRQQSPIADLYTGDELATSEKDRAENVMIVDLLRNDLSRVCSPGSVKVTGLCEVEVFETVQHLVSTVIGELRSGLDVWDLCAASFPGGSITGAPKIRAMEIVAELERTVRGAYCGSLFYLGPEGHFDSSILIRTFTLKDGRVQFPVGGGIVADSHPVDEYDETLHKASGMLRALVSGGSQERV